MAIGDYQERPSGGLVKAGNSYPVNVNASPQYPYSDQEIVSRLKSEEGDLQGRESPLAAAAMIGGSLISAWFGNEATEDASKASYAGTLASLDAQRESGMRHYEQQRRVQQMLSPYVQAGYEAMGYTGPQDYSSGFLGAGYEPLSYQDRTMVAPAELSPLQRRSIPGFSDEQIMAMSPEQYEMASYGSEGGGQVMGDKYGLAQASFDAEGAKQELISMGIPPDVAEQVKNDPLGDEQIRSLLDTYADGEAGLETIAHPNNKGIQDHRRPPGGLRDNVRWDASPSGDVPGREKGFWNQIKDNVGRIADDATKIGTFGISDNWEDNMLYGTGGAVVKDKTEGLIDKIKEGGEELAYSGLDPQQIEAYNRRMASYEAAPRTWERKPGAPKTGMRMFADQANAPLQQLQQYSAGGLPAFQQQQALAGSLGPQAQEMAISGIEQSPLMKALQSKQERSLLANRAATGGLRGGNTQAALAELAPQMLERQINQQYGRLGDISSTGANIGQFLSGIGQTATSDVARMGLAAASGQPLGSPGVSPQAQIIQQGGNQQAQAALAQGQNIQNLFGDVAQGIGMYYGMRNKPGMQTMGASNPSALGGP